MVYKSIQKDWKILELKNMSPVHTFKNGMKLKQDRKTDTS